jgi:NAD(P)H-nitrite reductase large subunit
VKFFKPTGSIDVRFINDNEYICYCIEVDKKTVVEAIRNGANTLEDIKKTTKACTGSQCKEKNPTGKCCAPQIRQLLAIYKGEDHGD